MSFGACVTLTFVHGHLHPHILWQPIDFIPSRTRGAHTGPGTVVDNELLQLIGMLLPGPSGLSIMSGYATNEVQLCAVGTRDTRVLNKFFEEVVLNVVPLSPAIIQLWVLAVILNRAFGKLPDMDLWRVVRYMQLFSSGLQASRLRVPVSLGFNFEVCRAFKVVYKDGLLDHVGAVQPKSVSDFDSLLPRFSQPFSTPVPMCRDLNLEVLRFFSPPSSPLNWKTFCELARWHGVATTEPYYDLDIWLHVDQDMSSHVLLDVLQARLVTHARTRQLESHISKLRFHLWDFFQREHADGLIRNGHLVQATFMDFQFAAFWFFEVCLPAREYNSEILRPDILPSQQHASLIGTPYKVILSRIHPRMGGVIETNVIHLAISMPELQAWTRQNSSTFIAEMILDRWSRALPSSPDGRVLQRVRPTASNVSFYARHDSAEDLYDLHNLRDGICASLEDWSPDRRPDPVSCLTAVVAEYFLMERAKGMRPSVMTTPHNEPGLGPHSLCLQRVWYHPHARIVHQAACGSVGLVSRDRTEQRDAQARFAGGASTATRQANLSTLPPDVSDLVDQGNAYRAEMNTSPTRSPIVRGPSSTEAVPTDGFRAGVEEPQVEAGPSSSGSNRAKGKAKVQDDADDDEEYRWTPKGVDVGRGSNNEDQNGGSGPVSKYKGKGKAAVVPTTQATNLSTSRRNDLPRPAMLKGKPCPTRHVLRTSRAAVMAPAMQSTDTADDDLMTAMSNSSISLRKTYAEVAGGKQRPRTGKANGNTHRPVDSGINGDVNGNARNNASGSVREQSSGNAITTGNEDAGGSTIDYWNRGMTTNTTNNARNNQQSHEHHGASSHANSSMTSVRDVINDGDPPAYWPPGLPPME